MLLDHVDILDHVDDVLVTACNLSRVVMSLDDHDFVVDLFEDATIDVISTISRIVDRVRHDCMQIAFVSDAQIYALELHATLVNKERVDEIEDTYVERNNRASEVTASNRDIVLVDRDERSLRVVVTHNVTVDRRALECLILHILHIERFIVVEHCMQSITIDLRLKK